MRIPKSTQKYNVKRVKNAKEIASLWLGKVGLIKPIIFGLPEVDDCYDVWRVPLISKVSNHKIGEIVIDALTTLINEHKTTTVEVLKERILNGNGHKKKKVLRNSESYHLSTQRNTVA